MRLTKEELREALNKKLILPYEHELIECLRGITYLSLPVSVSVLSLPVRNGNCYSMSELLTKGMDNFKLVHGNVNMYPLETSYPNHSWVEKDGYVYDPTAGCKYDKEFYYRKCEVEVIETYDEVSVHDYSFYNEVCEKINQDNVPSEQLAMMLQYLEMIELENNTINHHMLLDEIAICKNKYGANTVYDDKVMQKYKSYMKSFEK